MNDWNCCRKHLRGPTMVVWLAGFLLGIGLCRNGFATTVPAPGFTTMVAQAEQIFTGRVEAVKSDWALRGGRKCIVTTVSFQVEKMHKGVSVGRIQLDFLGGTVGSESMEVQGVPRFLAGERVILFTEGNGRQFCPLVGVYHGKLVINREIRSGTEVVLRYDGRPVTRTDDVGAGDPSGIAAAGPIASRPPLSVEAFIEGLTTEIRKGTRP